MNDNEKYTQQWVESFDLQKALDYDRKFYNKFQKNIKHRQQLQIIKKYINSETLWLDAPVGSGRIMGDIKHDREKCYIFDYSEIFLKFSKDRLDIKDSNVSQGDIFEISLDKKFNLITCNHMLFAFKNFDLIISKLIENLDSNGIIICDVVNKTMYEKLDIEYTETMKQSEGWNHKDIVDFSNSHNCEIVEIIPHDYFDNEYMLDWRRKGSYVSKKFKSLLWKLLNKVYFKFHLFNLFNMLEDKEKLALFNKLIVVMRKKIV